MTPESGLEIKTDKGFALVTNVEEKEVELQYFHPLQDRKLPSGLELRKLR